MYVTSLHTTFVLQLMQTRTPMSPMYFATHLVILPCPGVPDPGQTRYLRCSPALSRKPISHHADGGTDFY